MVNYSQNKEGTVPVPSLYSPLRFVIVKYYLFRELSQLGVLKSVGGKPKAMLPGTSEFDGKREVNPFISPVRGSFFCHSHPAYNDQIRF
jgi:hypothetical protein